eukprot:GILI01007717.1.p1 GENE.GILI01007717.1~~GILI01007717.1.p1  ORF type:complete len:164 (+),score=59.15 GILI01007717.1:31-522(+)
MSSRDDDVPEEERQWMDSLKKMDKDELLLLRQQLENELVQLRDSFTALSLAESRFKSSSDAVETLKSYEAGRPILVPLSDSLFVPGQVSENKKVLVDVGTGYYVEKAPAAAQEYLARKAVFSRQSADKVSEITRIKQKQMDVVTQMCQQKDQAATSAAAAQSS